MLVVTDHSWGQPLTLQYGEKARFFHYFNKTLKQLQKKEARTSTTWLFF